MRHPAHNAHYSPTFGALDLIISAKRLGHLWRRLARRSEYVAPRDQYDRDQDDDRHRHLPGDAVEKTTLFRPTGLHCHNYLLG